MNALIYKNLTEHGASFTCRVVRSLAKGLLCLGLACFALAPSALHAAQDGAPAPENAAAAPGKNIADDAAPALPSVEQAPAPPPDGTRELWTGKLYSSTYRAGVCLKNDGSVWGVLLLRVPSGKVDVYHFYGQHQAGHITARHTSGHTFEGQLENEQEVSGTVRLKNGFTVDLKGQRTHDVELTELCRPLPE